MSGTNPFRRKDSTNPNSTNPLAPPVHSAFLGRAESRITPIDTDVPRPSRFKTPKTVRIISPHSTTSDDGNGMPQNFFPSSLTVASSRPPEIPSPTSSDNESLEDPFSAGSDGTPASTEDDGTRQNTLSNSGISYKGALEPAGVPANPFKKTLASLNTEIDPNPPSLSSERRPQGADPSTTRPHYDVDDFKRLLLTGETSAPGAIAPAAPSVSFQSHHSIGDSSSSNTDASSISRQSIFEPVAGPLQESPRSSHEGSPSDDGRQQLVGSQLPGSQKIKPSAPRPRHGKLVKSNAPQTVSFEDPSLSIITSGISATTLQSQPTPKSPGTLSDMDKPLPPLPPSSNPGRAVEASSGTISIPKQEPHSDSSSTQASPNPQKRDPPAPPLSRRHSQLKPKPFTSSERSTPISEETSVESLPLSQSPPTTASKVPPPLPSRRNGGLGRVNSSSSVSTSASIPPTQPQTSTDDITSNPSKPRPPVPPNRSPTISSVKRQQTQPFSGSPSIAPPPPPRRRGSSTSSYTPSRLSGDYRNVVAERLRSDSGASSISQLQMTPMTPSRTESKDVLADLSALQREVDELRGKFKE